ncbi:MAG: glutamine--fructose-6-phosphate transaminase (isomerizing) [bacterium]
MCGIVGAVSKGNKNVLEYILTGLKRLEYRGYDSSGVCMLSGDDFTTVRAVGKIKELEHKLHDTHLSSHIGIGHTRWATHGKVSEKNAHPHIVGNIALVHNGIIENYSELKDELIKKGREFQSETDTEIIAHLLDMEYQKGKDELKAILNTIKKLHGMFSLGILFKNCPNTLFAVKCGTPLVAGKSSDTSFIASDVYPLVEYAETYAFLEDYEIARIEPNDIIVYNVKGKKVEKVFNPLNITGEELSKGGYKYYMEKEIHEQPQVIVNTIQDRISASRDEIIFDDLPLSKEQLRQIKRICIVGCGTAWHAGLLGKYYIEKYARIPVEVDVASEYRYRDPVTSKDVLTIMISQSGETADTLAAGREAKKKGSFLMCICNKPNSTMNRESNYTVFTQAGPEIGVAATKSFTSQVSVLLLFALYLGDVVGKLDKKELKNILEELVKIPFQIENVLKLSDLISETASKYLKFRTFLFIGRGVHYPIALEGALKLKEITYLHAEGYASGELKHGPIALVDNDLVLIAVCPKDDLYEKSLSNIEEVSARGGSIIAIGTEGDKRLEKISDVFIPLPVVNKDLMPILEVVPIQVLALNVAVKKGTDVDKPRNLAKSVTVE